MNLPCIFILFNDSCNCTWKSSYLRCRITKTTQLIAPNLSCMDISFLPAQWKCCIKLFRFHFLVHTHSPNALSHLTEEQRRTERKRNYGCPIFSFLSVLIFSVSVWIHREVTQEMIRVPWPFLLSSLCIQGKLNRNQGLAGLSAESPSCPPLLSNTLPLYSLWGVLDSCGMVGPLEFRGHCKCHMRWGSKHRWTYRSHISAHVHAPLSHGLHL